LAESTARKMRETGCNIAILERHGVVAYSASDIYDALDTIEALEDLAKIIIAKTILGKLASNTGSL
ncbi:MAG: class II aldolase/adducin family protein, partial [Acidilobaceae archaeon]